MNAILKQTLATAEEKLDADGQARLAELVSEVVESWSAASPFSADERAHLVDVAAEPFVAADPTEVADLFNKARG